MAEFSLIIGWLIVGLSCSSSLPTSPQFPSEGMATPFSSLEKWLLEYNQELEILKHQSAMALWKNLLDPRPLAAAKLKDSNAYIARWQRRKQAEAARLRYQVYLTNNPELSCLKFPCGWIERMIHLITRGPRYTSTLARSLSLLMSHMRDIYGSFEITYKNTTYRAERDFTHALRTSRDPDMLKWIWDTWHETVGPPVRRHFTHAVQIMNQAARLGGYRDMGEAWRAELDLGDAVNVRSVIGNLYNQVLPLYELLHSRVRHALREKYGDNWVNTNSSIPAHLLGDLWGQNWEALIDLILPDPFEANDLISNESSADTTRTIVKEANQFFEGLGFPKLPSSFWSLSVLGNTEAPPNATCHPRALDMYKADDYRLLLCGEESSEIRETAYHELGHIHYFHAYSAQPTLFRDGANSAAHETIGDTVELAVLSQKPALGKPEIQSDAIKRLLKTALRKLPLLAFARVVDEWRWDVFQGKIDERNYNRGWWALKRQFQGVTPTSPRSEKYFDPGAKFHIPDNTPYIRYFIAVIAQFQVHKHLCEVSGNTRPLHSCNIAQSKVAGELLWITLSLGSSISWKEFLMALTGTPDLDAAPLLEYFSPLVKWLRQEIREKKITVGW